MGRPHPKGAGSYLVGSFELRVITKAVGGDCGQRNFGPPWINASD